MKLLSNIQLLIFILALVNSSFCLCGCQSPPAPRPSVMEVPVPEVTPAPNPFVEVLRNPLPRIMIIVDEKALGTIPTAEVESIAQQILTENDIPVVDQDMVRADQARRKKLLKMVGDNRGAAAAGLQFGADLTIVGEAVVKPSARRIAESNLRNYQAVVTLRAIRTDNAAVLTSASETVSIIELDDVAGSSKALKKAADKVLTKLLPTGIKAWQANSGSQTKYDNHVSFSVGGTDQLWKVKAIRDSLRSHTKNIKKVTQRSYAAGVVVFEMDTDLPTEELAELLVLNPPDNLKLQVLLIEAGSIEGRAISN